MTKDQIRQELIGKIGARAARVEMTAWPMSELQTGNPRYVEDQLGYASQLHKIVRMIEAHEPVPHYYMSLLFEDEKRLLKEVEP